MLPVAFVDNAAPGGMPNVGLLPAETRTGRSRSGVRGVGTASPQVWGDTRLRDESSGHNSPTRADSRLNERGFRSSLLTGYVISDNRHPYNQPDAAGWLNVRDQRTSCSGDDLALKRNQGTNRTAAQRFDDAYLRL